MTRDEIGKIREFYKQNSVMVDLCDMALRCEEAEAQLAKAEVYLMMFMRGTNDVIVIQNCRAYFEAKGKEGKG